MVRDPVLFGADPVPEGDKVLDIKDAPNPGKPVQEHLLTVRIGVKHPLQDGKPGIPDGAGLKADALFHSPALTDVFLLRLLCPIPYFLQSETASCSL